MSAQELAKIIYDDALSEKAHAALKAIEEALKGTELTKSATLGVACMFMLHALWQAPEQDRWTTFEAVGMLLQYWLAPDTESDDPPPLH